MTHPELQSRVLFKYTKTENRGCSIQPARSIPYITVTRAIGRRSTNKNIPLQLNVDVAGPVVYPRMLTVCNLNQSMVYTIMVTM